jgi:pimeloyl-ACP methyl ester carboxylesterase
MNPHRPVPRQRVHPALSFAAAALAGFAAFAGAAEPVPADSTGRARAAQGTTPGAIDLQDCRLPHPAGLGSVAARCGSLVVPLDYAHPQVHRLALHVAVVPSLDRRGNREPLFVISGGPGQGAADFYAAYAGAFADVGRTRDIVLVDQRGTGRSNALKCSFPEEFETGVTSPELIRKLSTACREGLKARTEFYTTSVAVRDLDAVRAALGYPKIALYGVSYGTRVAQHYVRRFPQHARAVVLDGVVPPDLPLGPDTPVHAQRALDLMFRRCASEAACNTAFPDLARRFDELRGRLADAPVRLTLPDPATGEPQPMDFGSDHLIGAVRLLNYQTSSTSLLPLLIDRAAKGDYAPLASQLVMFASVLEDQLAYGMNAAVICTEDVPFFTPPDRDRLAKTYFGATQLDGLQALCEGWPRGVMDADLKQPLRSGVPALLLSGEADPVTPPEGAERAARGFTDAKHVVLRGQGHGQITVGCAPKLLARFIDAGTTKDLDVSCLAAAAPAPFFLDPSGPSP